MDYLIVVVLWMAVALPVALVVGRLFAVANPEAAVVRVDPGRRSVLR